MSKWKQKIKVITLLNALALGAMYAINRVISATSILKNLLKSGSGKYYHWKFGNLFYRKTGSGKPLLLIHDLNPISSGYEWGKLEERLGKNHTVYTIDLLGCGRSDKPGMTYTNYLYVQMISDFIKDVIGEKTSVAATGLSSSFVIMADFSNSELFDQILMINPVSLKKMNQIPEEKSKILKSIMFLPILGTMLYHIETNYRNIEYILTEQYIYNPFRIEQKHIDAYYEAAHHESGNGKYLKASLDGYYLNCNIQNALSKSNKNICILYGDKMEMEKKVAEEYQRINPSISSALLYNAKFLPHLETPEEMLKQIELCLSSEKR
ncbi:MAG: alpha/beta hydrolase [Lachnospiraceae bacterium]|nr:alpha/beta hydrolase [Lachnospiraceae bacterium]